MSGRRGRADVRGSDIQEMGLASTHFSEHSDAALLDLGRQLSAVMKVEADAWAAAEDENDDDGPRTLEARRLQGVTRAIVHRIEPMTATTVEGLRVKVQAFAWCTGNPPAEIRGADLDCFGRPTTDLCIVASILRDLAKGLPA